MAEPAKKKEAELVPFWYVVIKTELEKASLEGAFPGQKTAEGFICQQADRDLLMVVKIPWYLMANMMTRMATGRPLGV